MPRVNAPDRTRPAARRSFTAIELIVVLAIISVLVALLAGTVVRTITTVQTNNSRTALTKSQSALNRQWAASKDQFFKEDAARLYPAQWAYVYTMAGGDVNRARVIWMKVRLQQAF